MNTPMVTARNPAASLLVAAALAASLFASAAPAFAGGITFDLPRISFPEPQPAPIAAPNPEPPNPESANPAPANINRSCLNPTRVTQACTDK